MKGRIVTWLVILSIESLGAMPAKQIAQEQPQDRFLAALSGVLTFPLMVTYKMFGPADVEDLTTMYRKRGFTQKDQDYFQLNWYGEQRMGYDELFERKELEEEIQRETYGPNR